MDAVKVSDLLLHHFNGKVHAMRGLDSFDPHWQNFLPAFDHHVDVIRQHREARCEAEIPIVHRHIADEGIA